MSRLRVVVWLVVAVSCALGAGLAGATRQVVSPTARVVRRLAPPGAWDVFRVAWLPGVKRAVVGVDRGETDGGMDRLQLYAVDLGRASWTLIPVPDDSFCAFRGGLFPERITAVEVGFLATCLGPLADLDHDKRVWAYSFDTGQARQLFPYGTGFPAAGFSFAPGSKAGLINDGTGLEENLRWLRADRLSAPLRLRVDRVSDPSFSPDGKVVAVGVVTGITGVRGIGRSDAPWSIALLDPYKLKLRSVKTSYEQILRGGWSPDGRYFAFAWDAMRGPGGVSILRRRDMKVIPVFRGVVSGVDWIDTRTLVAAQTNETSVHRAGASSLAVLKISGPLG